MNKQDNGKHILEALNKLQEAYDKANFFNNAMQIMRIYNNASSYRNYLLLSMQCGLCEDVREYIAQCDAICAQCNNAMVALGNKAMQDALMSKWRELAINLL